MENNMKTKKSLIGFSIMGLLLISMQFSIAQQIGKEYQLFNGLESFAEEIDCDQFRDQLRDRFRDGTGDCDCDCDCDCDRNQYRDQFRDQFRDQYHNGTCDLDYLAQCDLDCDCDKHRTQDRDQLRNKTCTV